MGCLRLPSDSIIKTRKFYEIVRPNKNSAADADGEDFVVVVFDVSVDRRLSHLWWVHDLVPCRRFLLIYLLSVVNHFLAEGLDGMNMKLGINEFPKWIHYKRMTKIASNLRWPANRWHWNENGKFENRYRTLKTKVSIDIAPRTEGRPPLQWETHKSKCE